MYIRALLIRHQFSTQKCEGILKSFVDNNFAKMLATVIKRRHLSCKEI